MGKITGIAAGSAGNVTASVSHVTQTKAASLYGTHATVRLAPSGKLLDEWAWDASGVGRLDGPRGLALDGQGNIYIADTATDTIEKVSPREIYSPGGASLVRGLCSLTSRSL